MSDNADITEFKGEHRFLSNFWPADVSFDGAHYATVEHAYQAAKTLDEEWRAMIRVSTSPGRAKQIGRRVPLRADWENVKLEVMRGLLVQKFQNDPLRGLLLSTGTRNLVEGNTWGDTFWGVCRGIGTNHLGKLLMQIRKALQANSGEA